MTLANENDSRMQRRVLDVAEEPCKILMPIVGYENEPIRSVEDTVKPLRNILPAVEIHAHTAKLRCPNPPPDGLTHDESAAIMLYTMSWRPLDQCLYVALNATLRSEDRDKLQPWFSYLKLFLTALSRLPSKRKTVFRGVKSDLHQNYSKDEMIIWWGFSSCTTTIDVLKSELFLGETGTRTMFTIKCNSGKNIRNHSYIQKEKEILILPATQFKVVSCLKQGQDLQIIQLEEIRPVHPFLNPVVPPSPPIDTTSLVNTQLAAQSDTTSIESIQNIVLKVFNESIINVNNPTTLQQRPELSPYQNPEIEEEIEQCNRRSTVDLSERRLTDKDMPIIVIKAIIGKKCKELRLTSNKITFEGVWILMEELSNNKTVEDLSLWDNCIYDNGVMYIAQVLSMNTTLKILNLGKNKITDQGAEELADMLRRNRVLTELYLGDNDIRDKGVQMLAESIGKYNTTLEILSLVSNRFITNECVTYLNRMIMHNNTLKQLLLDNCNLLPKGKQTLQQAQRKKTNFAVYAR